MASDKVRDDARRQQPTGPDLQLWDDVTAAYRSAAGSDTPASGSNARTEEARRRGHDVGRSASPSAVAVDLYIDPVCPYTWVASRWLTEVQRLSPLDLRFDVMSLRMLNEGRVVDAGYRANVESSVGPSRVATAIRVHHGADALRAWHTAFGMQIFDYWRFPSRAEYHAATLHALAAAGLPSRLGDAADSDKYDEQLRRSHIEAVSAVGVDAGTPVMHIDGTAFFGPVLNAIPRGRTALHLFQGALLLSGCDEFFELKRTRTAPPDFT